MPDGRVLPIAQAHREFTVKVDGQAVGRQYQLLSVGVTLAANRIASARLAYLDGAAASGGFALSDSDLFTPGKTVEIRAGSGSSDDLLFKGIVVRHAIRIRDHSASQLVVECRHAAMKLAIARRNASYFDQSDSDVIDSLLGAAKVTGDVESISSKHKQLVQYRTSDWDFIVARATANGKLVWPKDDTLVVKAPKLASQPSVTLQYGATVLELDAEIDARRQLAAVRGVSWDPAQQALIQADGNAPSMTGPGNLSPDDLAAVGGVSQVELKHTAITETEAQAWADAAWLRARLDKSSGRVKCEGIGTVKPGDTVAIAGAGARFNGNVFVTAVRHEFDVVQGWKTHVQFGGIGADIGPDGDSVSQEAAANLLPHVNGLQIGVVVSNEDPDGEHRVRIRLPMIAAGDDGIWARAASLDAGKDRGFFFRPEIGDEVVAGCIDDDPRRAVILGMLHSSAKAAPLKGSDDNHQKLYKSRAGMRVFFDDDQKILKIDTPAGNAITLSEADKSLVLADQNGNKITLGSDGVKIESAKSLEMKAGTELKMQSGTSFEAKGGTELKLEGGTQAELSSSATTKVSGGLVQIN